MGLRSSGRPRVYVHTLGCPKNEADSRALARTLAEAGAVFVEGPEEATHILLNTCGFIREAKEESIAAILDATGSYPDKKVIVIGCLVERYRDELVLGIPEVAGWFGLVGGPDQAALVRSLADGRTAGPAVEIPEAEGVGRSAGDATLSREAYAYLKISDGCDELCTFCAIPGIKGPYHAALPGEILVEAGACLNAGAKELVLVGQDTARWESGGLELAGLAETLASDPRLTWVRVMYLQPEHVGDAFLERMGKGGKLCPYLDLPLQHSHPEVLRRMGRAGDGESYLELIEKARRIIPGVAVRSAFIVGFPGETEEQFQHLLDFVREAEFDYAGAFVYSPEEGTPAAKLRPAVPRRVARERFNRLNSVLAEVAEAVHGRQVGTTLDVMIDALGSEEDEAGPEAVGRTRGQAPEVDGVVHVEGSLPDGVKVGDVIRVTIDAAVGYDFVGTCTGVGGDEA
jgi:ribosomal protein S12 methylthiotransferase